MEIALLLGTAAKGCSLLDPIRLYIGSPADFEEGSNCNHLPPWLQTRLFLYETFDSELYIKGNKGLTAV